MKFISDFFDIRRRQKDLMDKKPLPVGLSEFHEWSERIISGAMLPATLESQKYTLANMILHMKPTEDSAEDAYFIKSLRKFAANQVADHYRQKIYPEVKARLAAEEAEKNKTQPGEETPPAEADGKVLEIARVPGTSA